MDAVGWLIVAVIVAGVLTWFAKRREAMQELQQDHRTQQTQAQDVDSVLVRLSGGSLDGQVLPVDSDQRELTTPHYERYERTSGYSEGFPVFRWMDPSKR